MILVEVESAMVVSHLLPLKSTIL